MTQPTHPLFDAYPLDGEHSISTGSVPTPYHIYDGHGLLIGGTADLASAKALLQHEDVVPLETTAGRAVAGVWVVDGTAASLGPHIELQVSLLVAHQPQPPIDDHPLTLLKALSVNPQARMFCHGLWNNTATVVAYNRELLGLDARLCEGEIDRADGRKQFRITDEAGALLAEGTVREDERPSSKMAWSLLRLLGVRQMMAAASEGWLGASVVNPKSDALPLNGDAQTYVAADTPVVQLFDPATDSLTLGPEADAGLAFRPSFLEHFSPFRFVYLSPVRAA